MELLPSADPGPTQVLPEPALIPESPELTEKPEGTAIAPPGREGASRKIQRSKTEIAANELAIKVRYRQVKTRALGDPAVQSEWKVAQTAPTDAQKRDGLRRYYKLLYGRMAKIDKSLKKEISEREALALKRLQQNRIDPSSPIDTVDREPRGQIDPDDREGRVQIRADAL